MSSAGEPPDAEEIARILAAWQVDGKLAAAGVLAQLDAMRAWIAQRWPDAKPHWEIPVEAIHAGGGSRRLLVGPRLRGRSRKASA